MLLLSSLAWNIIFSLNSAFFCSSSKFFCFSSSILRWDSEIKKKIARCFLVIWQLILFFRYVFYKLPDFVTGGYCHLSCLSTPCHRLGDENHHSKAGETTGYTGHSGRSSNTSSSQMMQNKTTANNISSNWGQGQHVALWAKEDRHYL